MDSASLTAEPQPHLEKTRIDLEEKAAQLRENDIPTLEEERDNLATELAEEYGDARKVPNAERGDFNALEQAIANLQRTHDKFLHIVHGDSVTDTDRLYHPDDIDSDIGETFSGWGESVFILQELSGAMLSTVQDELSSATTDIDLETRNVDATPREGLKRDLWLRFTVIEAPDDAPSDPADYNAKLAEYLYEESQRLNGEGEVDTGNSSLQEAMESA